MSTFHKTSGIRLKPWLCATTVPLLAFSCASPNAPAASLGGVPCGVQNRVRERRERFFAANQRRRVCNDWPLVAALLLVLSLIVAGLGLRPATMLSAHGDAMKRRSKAGGEPTKGRRRKTGARKTRITPKALRPRSSSAASQETKVARLTRELNEALERQAATADVLKVISRSTFDLEVVLDTLVKSAARLCHSDHAGLFRREGEFYRLAANFGFSKEELKRIKQYFITMVLSPGRGSIVGRTVLEAKPVQIADVLADPEYTLPAQKIGNYRTALGIPLLREGVPIGVFFLSRCQVNPFTEKQVELVTTFADQAVIAIENARLLNELRQRTTDLTEALEQQTATSEVLQVISNSPGDLGPVFETVLEKAVRICDAAFGNIYRWDGDALHLVATQNAPPAFAEARRLSAFRPSPKTPTGRMIANKTLVHTADLRAEKAYADRNPWIVAGVELGGARTVLMVPMLKENELIGAFSVYRQEVRPFSDKQIELVKNFAAQAVIAIENARLLNELRERTDDLTGRTADLTEALEQQTATSEVLQVISSSPGDLEPVFAAMLGNAVRISGAKFGIIHSWDGEYLRLLATCNLPRALEQARKSEPKFKPGPKTGIRRMAATKSIIHIPDLREDEAYIEEPTPQIVAAVEQGVRTMLIVPMLKENEVVGAFTVYRQEVRDFTDKQIELVKNFAAQAVIAIENARLLNELRQRTTDLSEALEQQTATSEVLQIISSSPGNLEPVFATMVENAVRICHAQWGNIHIWDGQILHLVATHNVPNAFAAFRRSNPHYRPHPKGLFGRLAATQTATQIADSAAIDAYTERLDPVHVAAVELGGARTALGVPMLKENQLIGAFALIRQEVRPFTEKQIALLENFAAQAVIAIENARLLRELRERTDEVVKLNQQLEHRVSDQIGEIERMSRLRRFLPPQVADLIVASGTEKQLESHRREITALFCDLRGFTGFSESADPEDVMTLLREYHEALGASIIKYSGTLERYAGDGVMVVFNDPVPVENPALQAVLMALEMRDAIGALIETWRRWGHDIGFGIGIAHGFATLGTIGFEGRFDYAAIGTVSNVASRLCDEAKPGQILISPRVLTKVENAVKVEPVGEFELKGIRRPLAAYNVVAAAT